MGTKIETTHTNRAGIRIDGHTRIGHALGSQVAEVTAFDGTTKFYGQTLFEDRHKKGLSWVAGKLLGKATTYEVMVLESWQDGDEQPDRKEKPAEGVFPLVSKRTKPLDGGGDMNTVFQYVDDSEIEPSLTEASQTV